MTTNSPDTDARRQHVGDLIKATRKQHGWSIETAAADHAEIGHMTWRRVESGQSVHAKSYRAIDRAMGWPEGRIQYAIHGQDDPTHILTVATIETVTNDTNEAPLPMVLSLLERLTVTELQTASNAAHQRLHEHTTAIDAAKRELAACQKLTTRDTTTDTTHFTHEQMQQLTRTLHTQVQAQDELLRLSEQVYSLETQRDVTRADITTVSNHIRAIRSRLLEAIGTTDGLN